MGIALIGCSTPAEQQVPDLILVGGNIITVDSTDRIVEALAIKENIITAIGTTQEIEALAIKQQNYEIPTLHRTTGVRNVPGPECG